LTLVLPRRATGGICDLVTAGLDTVAVRVPSHPVARDLLRRAGVPIAAPSANTSGHVSPTTAAHVDADLGAHVAMILDGGPAQHGLESTVVRVTDAGVALLRPGAVTADQIEAILGVRVLRTFAGGAAPMSPGQLESHYAPRAAVRLDAVDVAPGEALLAFGGLTPAATGPAINLSVRGDLIEAAANLFASLRALDRPEVSAIAVMPIPEHGLGEAINDRLRRAAKGR
jgi:L-threonylcarbamoyladenylate synthase